MKEVEGGRQDPIRDQEILGSSRVKISRREATNLAECVQLVQHLKVHVKMPEVDSNGMIDSTDDHTLVLQ